MSVSTEYGDKGPRDEPSKRQLRAFVEWGVRFFSDTKPPLGVKSLTQPPSSGQKVIRFPLRKDPEIK